MNYYTYLIVLMLLLLGFLFALLEFGKSIGNRHLSEDPKGSKIGVSQVEGTVFALLGLLIAFTFYGAAQRFDIRRQMIVNETNAIGTAWLRVDLLPNEIQPQMRTLFRKYTDARIAVNSKLPDIEASRKQMILADNLQNQIWQLSSHASINPPNQTIAVVVLPSLNNMFDIATAHNVSLRTHPPLMVYLTLVLLLSCSTFYLGYSLAGGKRTNWLHGIGYICVMVIILYVVVDFEFPRAGLLKVTDFDQPLIELREKMK